MAGLGEAFWIIYIIPAKPQPSIEIIIGIIIDMIIEIIIEIIIEVLIKQMIGIMLEIIIEFIIEIIIGIIIEIIIDSGWCHKSLVEIKSKSRRMFHPLYKTTMKNKRKFDTL